MDLVTFTEEILNGKLNTLYSGMSDSVLNTPMLSTIIYLFNLFLYSIYLSSYTSYFFPYESVELFKIVGKIRITTLAKDSSKYASLCNIKP